MAEYAPLDVKERVIIRNGEMPSMFIRNKCSLESKLPCIERVP